MREGQGARLAREGRVGTLPTKLPPPNCTNLPATACPLLPARFCLPATACLLLPARYYQTESHAARLCATACPLLPARYCQVESNAARLRALLAGTGINVDRFAAAYPLILDVDTFEVALEVWGGEVVGGAHPGCGHVRGGT